MKTGCQKNKSFVRSDPVGVLPMYLCFAVRRYIWEKGEEKVGGRKIGWAADDKVERWSGVARWRIDSFNLLFIRWTFHPC
mmetsp:Transcript_8726/g.23578  ORF Transcript_8726/g.23578 Transcript_8726/m.23578 type:complete len:80 (-) Transcript_8726:166-405(-)